MFALCFSAVLGVTLGIAIGTLAIGAACIIIRLADRWFADAYKGMFVEDEPEKPKVK
jgi:hypothetical protein